MPVPFIYIFFLRLYLVFVYFMLLQTTPDGPDGLFYLLSIGPFAYLPVSAKMLDVH